MSKHGTDSSFPDWYITFQQAALAALPRPPELDQGVALGWADNGESFANALAIALLPPKEAVLKPKPELLLEPVGMATIAATAEKFVASEKFVVNTGPNARVKICGLGSNFQNWFLDKVEEPIGETTLRCQSLRKASRDIPIINELGGEEKVETTLTEIYALMERQKNGEKGILLTSGSVNVFYDPDINGTLRAVLVLWDDWDGGWGVSASDVRDLGRWS